jgi:two-component system chemotaxis response regulator CheY
MKCLIINNSHYITTVIIKTLNELGHTECDVFKGDVSIEDTLSIGEYGFLICDAESINRTVFNLLASVRGDEKIRNTKILILKEVMGKTLIDKIQESEHSSYLVKPFTPSGLREKIKGLL